MMSANQRGLEQPSRLQSLRKKSKDIRDGFKEEEVFHRISRWYPSVSDTPEEPIIFTTNGDIPNINKSKPPEIRDPRSESRLRVPSGAESIDITSDHSHKSEGKTFDRIIPGLKHLHTATKDIASL